MMNFDQSKSFTWSCTHWHPKQNWGLISKKEGDMGIRKETKVSVITMFFRILSDYILPSQWNDLSRLAYCCNKHPQNFSSLIIYSLTLQFNMVRGWDPLQLLRDPVSLYLVQLLSLNSSVQDSSERGRSIGKAHTMLKCLGYHISHIPLWELGNVWLGLQGEEVVLVSISSASAMLQLSEI